MDAMDAAFIFECVAVMVVCSYGSYRYGKHAERVDYTAAYRQQIEAAFWNGYETAKKQQMMVPEK